MNFMLRFLLNLSITHLPAEDLNELCGAFQTELVYYSLTSIAVSQGSSRYI